jgi:hypothetical protein
MHVVGEQKGLHYGLWQFELGGGGCVLWPSKRSRTGLEGDGLTNLRKWVRSQDSKMVVFDQPDSLTVALVPGEVLVKKSGWNFLPGKTKN